MELSLTDSSIQEEQASLTVTDPLYDDDTGDGARADFTLSVVRRGGGGYAVKLHVAGLSGPDYDPRALSEHLLVDLTLNGSQIRGEQ